MVGLWFVFGMFWDISRRIYFWVIFQNTLVRFNRTSTPTMLFHCSRNTASQRKTMVFKPSTCDKLVDLTKETSS